jgi:hypothetical protein
VLWNTIYNTHPFTGCECIHLKKQTKGGFFIMSKRSVNLLRRGMTPGMGLTAESFQQTGGQKTSSESVTTGTIAVTANTAYNVKITQPAGTIVKDIVLTNNGDLTSGAHASTGNLTVSLGSALDGTDLVNNPALLNGNAVAWTANNPLWWIKDCHGHAANDFVAGVGPTGGPATSAAITPALSFYSASGRSLWVRFKTGSSTVMSTAATTITVTVTYLYL